MKLIDVHSHVSAAAFPGVPDPASAARWPCMQCQSPSQGTLHIGDKPFRELDSRSWDAGRRIEDMDRDGVALQVLSPMPELLSYWLEPAAAQVLCDHSNDQIARMVAANPTRFRGLGCIPLQVPADAYRYLKRIRQTFGLLGVEIGSNINGRMLGDSMFDEFFAAAAELGVCVFVHALHPVATAKIEASPALTAFAGFPIDVAMAVSSLLMAGTIDRYPSLRIAFSHGGGAVGSMVGRLDVGWQKTEGYGGKALSRPSEQIKKLYFDSNVYDGAYLRFLTELAPRRVFAGTDYPYLIMQEAPATFLEAAELTRNEASSVAYGAALAFLDDPTCRALRSEWQA